MLPLYEDPCFTFRFSDDRIIPLASTWKASRPVGGWKSNDGHVTTRFRQAIGVVVRIIMESHGWKTTGRKGSLGVRVKAPTRTATAGAYHNTGGLACGSPVPSVTNSWPGSPYRSVEERAAEIELTTATTVLE